MLGLVPSVDVPHYAVMFLGAFLEEALGTTNVRPPGREALYFIYHQFFSADISILAFPFPIPVAVLAVAGQRLKILGLDPV